MLMKNIYLFEDIENEFDDEFEFYEDDDEELSEETYFDLNEDMEKYYDFNLLDLLEDINLDIQDMPISERNKLLEGK